jgi:hypothetical protein
MSAIRATAKDYYGFVDLFLKQTYKSETPRENRSILRHSGGIYFYANGFSWDGVSNQKTEEGDPRQNIPEDAVGEFKTVTA